MKVYLPAGKGKKWLGPYSYSLSEMISPVEKIIEILLMCGYIELEPREEELALRILNDLPEPFRQEFRKVIDAHLEAERICREIEQS
jgi:hypothetical protein